jgi:hypothetical protein
MVASIRTTAAPDGHATVPPFSHKEAQKAQEAQKNLSLDGLSCSIHLWFFGIVSKSLLVLAFVPFVFSCAFCR